MIHPIDNQYRYGICYDLKGQIVGFNLSPDVCICLTDDEIERVLGEYAKRKQEQEQDEFLCTVGEIAKSINRLAGKTEEQNKGGRVNDY